MSRSIPAPATPWVRLSARTIAVLAIAALTAAGAPGAGAGAYAAGTPTLVPATAATTIAAPLQDVEDEALEPVPLTLETRDGVLLSATYYPSARGRDAAPVVLLHNYGGSQNDWGDFPRRLQADGFAVVTLDLRGHGGSRQLVNGAEITYEALRRPGFIAMQEDLEALKRELLRRHNAEELNIERLGIVGTEMSAVVAARWAASDWSWPPLPDGTKQGQDVRALVLMSPTYNYEGVPIGPAMRALRGNVRMLIMVGSRDQEAQRDAERLFSLVEPNADSPERQISFYREYPVNFAGTEMLGRNLQASNTSGDATLEDDLHNFLGLALVEPNVRWVARSRRND